MLRKLPHGCDVVPSATGMKENKNSVLHLKGHLYLFLGISWLCSDCMEPHAGHYQYILTVHHNIWPLQNLNPNIRGSKS